MQSDKKTSVAAKTPTRPFKRIEAISVFMHAFRRGIKRDNRPCMFWSAALLDHGPKVPEIVFCFARGNTGVDPAMLFDECDQVVIVRVP